MQIIWKTHLDAIDIDTFNIIMNVQMSRDKAEFFCMQRDFFAIFDICRCFQLNSNSSLKGKGSQIWFNGQVVPRSQINE